MEITCNHSFGNESDDLSGDFAHMQWCSVTLLGIYSPTIAKILAFSGPGNPAARL